MIKNILFTALCYAKKLQITLTNKGRVKIGKKVTLGKFVIVNTDLGGFCEVMDDTQLCNNSQIYTWGGIVKINKNVFLGPFVVVYGHGNVEIGENSLISMHCCIISSNHTIRNNRKNIRDYPDISLPTSIGRDVWLGAGVQVMGGVTIGDGCVVGAGAVVVKSLPPYSISAGVPAKVMGFRE